MSGYAIPNTLDDVLDLIATGEWRVLAGGTDFYPAYVDAVVRDNVLDISRIESLAGITRTDRHWRIGASTTWTDVIQADFPAAFDGLKEAAREVGGEQIQNAGTLAGNLCNASPAADGVPPLLTLDAIVELSSTKGVREIPLSAFIRGNRQTAIRADELMTAIIIPRDRDDARTRFLKLGARKYLVISIVMVAALVDVSTSGEIQDARVAVGSCSGVAQRLLSLERALLGQPVSIDLSLFVERQHLSLLSPINDVRASAGYRLDAAEELVRRALADCLSGF
jgi:CO/xanthine dehydrogenase FAD-binding subunit